MNFPEKWRETIDPFQLPYKNFILKEVLGYPHAGNDVFYVKGIYRDEEVFAFIKVNRQRGADVANEIDILSKIHLEHTPPIIDYDEQKSFRVSLALEGERLSTLVGDNENLESLSYMEEYGEMLGKIHSIKGDFQPVKDRPFFHIMDKDKFTENNLEFVYNYLITYEPKTIHQCFVHGDFHYANILWKNHHFSGILDFELSGIGNKEFDIAWAIINRPGQKFLKNPKEVDQFLKGYRKFGTYNNEYIQYYMCLIYSRFYFLGEEDYKIFVKNWFLKFSN